MKICSEFLLVIFCLNTAWADFSYVNFQMHPIEPGFWPTQPYLIEITGEWPTDCHPGEQKPVIREYTGDTTLVEFETIVHHVTCNDVPTPYRVLIDMSDVFDNVTEFYPRNEVTLRFGGAEYTRILDLICICSPAPVHLDIKPEPGLYANEELDKQGLILARQNHRMGVYPLIYDESGSSEWLFGGNGIVDDVFFTNLYELTGGQCLGCPVPDQLTQMDVVGKLSMLMDSEGVIQVKINDGLFKEYRPLVFGYGEVNIGGNPSISIPDLAGRWAFVDISIKRSFGSPPPTSVLPLVFDIFLMPPPTIGLVPPPPLGTPPPGNASYLIRGIEGEEVAEMRCEYTTAMVCELDSSENPDGYAVELLSPERIIMSNLSPISMGTIGTGTAVRID